jgi:hypothetical protein
MSTQTRHISIAIPTYEMHGLGKKFLKFSFDILVKQTFKDFDVVISDHSKTNDIEDLCKEYKNVLDIKYFRNENKRGNSPSNTNNAITHATGKLIKILFQDDFLFSTTALAEIVDAFDLTKDSWLLTACESSRDGVTFFRPLFPQYNNRTHFGKNQIGPPSVLTIKNESPLLFDENLVWRMDGDYYTRCYNKFGAPKILNKINVVSRIGSHQISSTRTEEDLQDKEFIYILTKYAVPYSQYHIAINKLHRKINWLKRTTKKLVKKII